jgi:hypothetical protein
VPGLLFEKGSCQKTHKQTRKKKKKNGKKERKKEKKEIGSLLTFFPLFL